MIGAGVGSLARPVGLGLSRSRGARGADFVVAIGQEQLQIWRSGVEERPGDGF